MSIFLHLFLDRRSANLFQTQCIRISTSTGAYAVEQQDWDGMGKASPFPTIPSHPVVWVCGLEPRAELSRQKPARIHLSPSKLSFRSRALNFQPQVARLHSPSPSTPSHLQSFPSNPRNCKAGVAAPCHSLLLPYHARPRPATFVRTEHWPFDWAVRLLLQPSAPLPASRNLR